MFKALKSFSGKVSMKKGDVKELTDAFIISDLLNAGYIEEIKDDTKKVESKVKEEIKKIESKAKEEVKEVETEVKKKTEVKSKKKKSK